MKVLVVIDMQNDFVEGSLGSKEAQAIVPAVVQRVQAAEDAGETIFFTRDTHHINYLDTFEGKHLPVEHCIRGMNGWQIIDELSGAVERSGNIIDKPTFGSTILLEVLTEMLKTEKTMEIELIGLCTDICVISNALLLRAHFPSMPLSVRADCCAGVTPALHESALAVMRSCQIEVL